MVRKAWRNRAGPPRAVKIELELAHAPVDDEFTRHDERRFGSSEDTALRLRLPLAFQIA